MDRAREVAHLAQADSHVVEGERRLTEQAMRIARLRADGHDSTMAEAMLGTLERTLAEWQGHREVIVRLIHQIDAGLA